MRKIFTYLAAFMLPMAVWGQDGDVTDVSNSITTAEALKTAVQNSGLETIELGANITLSEMLTINRPLTIDGKGYTISGENNSSNQDDHRHVIIVQFNTANDGDVVTLKNLTLTKGKDSGLNAQKASKVILNNVTLKDNAEAGMIVHCPVEATGLTTEGNNWGGVNVDESNDNNDGVIPSLTIDASCSFKESAQIWSDDATNTSNNYVIDKGCVYKNNVFKWNGKNVNQRFWAKENNTISDVASLRMAVAVGVNVNLSAGTYELDKQLVVDKPMTITGEGMGETILTANHEGNWPGSNSSQKNLVSLGGDGDGKIIFNDLTIQNSVASGMNAQTGYDVVLDNVAFKNNTNAGLIVHGSVEANGIVTEGNGWGGVNVDKGTPEYAVSFTFDENCTFNEASKVWSELGVDDNPSTVNAPAGWNTFDLDGKRFWTNEKVAAEGEVNVVYVVTDGTNSTDKASIKVKYDGKPAMAYNVLPKGKEIEIIVEPLVGYSLQSVTSVKVNGGDATKKEGEDYVYTYTVPSDETSVITIAAVVSTQQNSSLPEGTVNITETVSDVVTNPTIVASSTDFNVSEGEQVAIVSEKEEESEIELYINDINDKYNTSISSSNVVAYNITPVVIKDNKVEKIAEVSADSEVTLVFPYPAGYDKSDLESVTVYHFADNGDIESYTGTLNDNYISISGVKSFSPFVLTYTVAEPPVVITYHDLHITESVGAKLVSRNGKDRTPDGGSFTLSLEKEEGYEDCEPTVYYKRGRFDDWKELKLDEVSGYYQIRSVYTDIYVKVSGDGIWPVSNEEVEAQEVKVYTQNGAIVVSSPSLMDVQIISMTGSVVAADKVAGQREFRNIAEGIYVVRVGEEIVKVRL